MHQIEVSMSQALPILHMLTPLKHISPFDVSMAADAGFKVIVPYTNVTLDEVTGLVQDAIFSRPPDDGVRTGIFIAGRDAVLALDMMQSARAAMVGPFQVSVFADPAGSFTTAAAMVARTERMLQRRFHRSLENIRVAVFGATGVVGFSSAVIAAQEGARVAIVGRDGLERVKATADRAAERFKVTLEPVDGSSEDLKRRIIAETEVIVCAAAAGKQVLRLHHLQAGKSLLAVADVNAVPPPGVEGMELFADEAPIGGSQALAIGPLAIGNVKYRTEADLFRRMTETDKPLTIDFRDAFELARKLVT
jgi:methylene-tetrahydromethanopterin dehydrogenase